MSVGRSENNLGGQTKKNSGPVEVIILLKSPKDNLNNPYDLRRSSPLRSTSSGGPVCRICHDGDRPENLISPCDCTGTVALVHVSCIEQWLTTSNNDHCEICKFKFSTYKESRPISQWITERGRGRPNGFYGDLICLLLLTPLCVISVYLCTMGSLAYLERGLWEGVGLAILTLFVLLAYLLWGFVTIRFHLDCYKRWRNTNQVVHLSESQTQASIQNNNYVVHPPEA